MAPLYHPALRLSRTSLLKTRDWSTPIGRPQKRRSRRLGARISLGVTEVKGMGWLSMIVDPKGAKLGLWEPKDM
jgi:hypothetical protein